MKNTTDDHKNLNGEHFKNQGNFSTNNRTAGYVDIYSSERRKERKKNRISIIRFLSFIFFLLLGMIGVTMIYAYTTLKSFNYQELQPTDQSPTANEVSIQDGLINDNMVLNTLLIGSDSMSTGDGGRSDSLLVVSLNIRSKKIKVTSIMRDTWVNIPGYGKDRMNAAYAYGGPKLTIETVQKNFGILIDRYVCVDFEGFCQIIDTLGGIDIELTANECSYINTYSGDKNTLKGAGVKHLTGLQALHHSRNRNSLGSDYDRTSRQRDVIRAVIETLKKSSITKITEMMSTLAPLVTTNFRTAEITRLALSSMTYLNYPMDEFRIPTDDNVKDEIHNQKMVLVIRDIKKTKSELKEFIYEGSNPEEESTNQTSNTKHK